MQITQHCPDDDDDGGGGAAEQQQNSPECNHSPESDSVCECTLYNVQEDVKGITIRESVSYVVTLSTGKNIL